MKRRIKFFLYSVILSYIRYMTYRYYSSQFKRFLKRQGFENKKAVGEEEYMAKWKMLCKKVEPYSYRFFCHYCGNTPNIIPEDIGRSYVETVLNPPVLRPAYSDKNVFPRIIGEGHMPKTLICRINGGTLLDKDFRQADRELKCYIGDTEALVLKPSVGSCSGRGVILFRKEGEIFLSSDKSQILSRDFLLSYGRDFCLQEAVRQHEFMSGLCSTSVNTIRISLYRSVKDEKSYVTAAIVRIGQEGSFLDNAHAGGRFVRVQLKTGELGKFVMDQYGNRTTIWNNLDFSKSNNIIPCWKDVISFAEYVGSRIPHHRLLALDIALREDCKPILIEYNIDSFGYWAFMMTGQEVFGEYTDEIIEYCRKNRHVAIDRIH